MHARHPQPRHESPRLQRRAPVALVLLAVLLWTAALAGTGRADDAATLEVTTCTAEQTAAECEASGDAIVLDQQPAPKPAAKPTPAPQPTAPGTERHDVELASGTDTVATEDGVVAEELPVTNAAPAEDAGERDEHRPAPDAPDTLAPVTTDAGSPFTGFGSGLSYLTPDEALSRFAIPPFLLPIYVAAGRAYNVPWNLLAAINQIETDFGRIGHQVSSAGALGWMQFMPATWRAWGVDASGDGIADPYNPVDAIYAAARYLQASGGETDLRRAVFAYNHADWYVDSVLKTAGVYGSLPGGLVDETGSLAFGRFPLLGEVSYGDDFRRAQQAHRTPAGLLIGGEPGARAVATQQVTVKRILLGPALVAAVRSGQGEALAGHRARHGDVARLRDPCAGESCPARGLAPLGCVRSADGADGDAGLPVGFGDSVREGIGVVVADALDNQYRYDGLARLAPGVRPGAVLRGRQRIGQLPDEASAQLRFSLRAAGGAAVDPRPIIDGYRLQEAADFAHAVAPLGGNPFVSSDDSELRAGIVSGSERALAQRVLADAGIQIYEGGRQDIARGLIDRRVLGALLYLRRSGLTLGVSSLRSGHGYYTAGGNVSAHSYGAAADIASFNGQPVLGHQGPGSLIEQAMRLLMRLDGAAQPAQLISLMNLGGPSFAMSDHYDHLHMGYGFSPAIAVGRSGDALGSVTFDGRGLGGVAGDRAPSAGDEQRLSSKLGAIANPHVRDEASSAGVAVEGEQPEEHAAVDAPLETLSDAAPAKLIDVAVPARGSAAHAWAIGTVDGRGRGWAAEQVVVLRRSGGAWQLVGPPVGPDGRARNPRLSALGVVRDGGYAVGAKGSVVEIRANGAPLLLGTTTKADLHGVAARLDGDALTGIAVGDRGTAVELVGGRATVAQAADRSATLRAVIDGGAPIAVGSQAGGAVVVGRGPDGWASIGDDLGSLRSARLWAVARRGSELWIAGGLSDAADATGATTRPLAARLDDGGWKVWCAGEAALAAVTELGSAQRHGCEGTIAAADGHGAAADLALTEHGPVLAAGGALQMLDQRSNDFRPMPTVAAALPGLGGEAPDAWRLAVDATGRGWALLPGGRMTRVAEAGVRAAADAANGPGPSQLERGRPATVAVSPGGDRVLATTGEEALYAAGDGWAGAPSPGATLRSVALGEQDGWAVTSAGDLLRLNGDAWEPVASDSGWQRRIQAAFEAVGWDGAGAAPPVVGWSDVAADAEGLGYVVGSGGAIWRLQDGAATAEHSPVTGDLTSVTVFAGGAVATGAGVLIERGSDGWTERGDVRELVGGAPLTATAAAQDGTVVAAGGGTIVARGAGTSQWGRTALAPLGLEVRELAAFRAADGTLTVVVLAGTEAVDVLLQGDAGGWRALAVPGLEVVSDFDLDARTGILAVGGLRDGAAAVETLELFGSGA